MKDIDLWSITNNPMKLVDHYRTLHLRYLIEVKLPFIETYTLPRFGIRSFEKICIINNNNFCTVTGALYHSDILRKIFN